MLSTFLMNNLIDFTLHLTSNTNVIYIGLGNEKASSSIFFSNWNCNKKGWCRKCFMLFRHFGDFPPLNCWQHSTLTITPPVVELRAIFSKVTYEATAQHFKVYIGRAIQALFQGRKEKETESTLCNWAANTSWPNLNIGQIIFQYEISPEL